MNKSIRVNTAKEDKSARIRIQQSYNSIDILSLTLGQVNQFPSNNADIGIVIGRVEAQGVGIPNAKVSIFVPLDEQDASDPEISSLYPFATINDTDSNGNRYNLLPKFRASPLSNNYFGNNPYGEGFGENKYGLGYKPDYPVGTLPTNEEVCVNDRLAYVASKYYRYTAVTNDSGDFCIMGVPVGTHILHIDADLTDIGRFSMKPIVLSNFLGYPESLFENGGTRIRENTRISNAKHIISQNTPIEVIPMWGDRNADPNAEIGITLANQTLNTEIKPTTTIFHSGMTMAKDAYYYDYVGFRMLIGLLRLTIDIGIAVFRIPLPFPAFNIDVTSNTCTVNGGESSLDPFVIQVRGFVDNYDFDADPSDFDGEPSNKLFLSQHRATRINGQLLDYRIPIDPVQLVEGQFARVEDVGSVAYIVPCNKRKIVTDPDGNDRVVPDDSPEGVFTEFDGALITRMEGGMDNPPTKIATDRVFMKVPQNVRYEDSPAQWIDEYRTFEAGKYYSVVQRWASKKTSSDSGCREYDNVGMVVNLEDKDNEGTPRPQFSDFKLDYNDPNGCGGPNGYDFFMGKNVHFCLYHLQYGYKLVGNRRITCPDIVGQGNIRYNNNPLGGGLVSTQHLARGDLYKTDFIEVPKRDILLLLNDCPRSNYGLGLVGRYYGVEDELGIDSPSERSNVLFFKGIKESDCLFMLYKYNLI